jgi:hypothetical protein
MIDFASLHPMVWALIIVLIIVIIAAFLNNRSLAIKQAEQKDAESKLVEETIIVPVDTSATPSGTAPTMSAPEAASTADSVSTDQVAVAADPVPAVVETEVVNLVKPMSTYNYKFPELVADGTIVPFPFFRYKDMVGYPVLKSFEGLGAYNLEGLSVFGGLYSNVFIGLGAFAKKTFIDNKLDPVVMKQLVGRVGLVDSDPTSWSYKADAVLTAAGFPRTAYSGADYLCSSGISTPFRRGADGSVEYPRLGAESIAKLTKMGYDMAGGVSSKALGVDACGRAANINANQVPDIVSEIAVGSCSADQMKDPSHWCDKADEFLLAKSM